MAIVSLGACRGPEDRSIYVDANTRIQILETMMDLPTAEKEQCAAFIVSVEYSNLVFPVSRFPKRLELQIRCSRFELLKRVLMITYSNVLYYLKTSLRLYETS